MDYTFKGKDYPKNIKLHHPEIETILSKDPLDITLREMNYLYVLPLESFTEDENNLILRELGRQQGKTAQGGLSVAGGCRCLTKDGNTSIEKEGYIPYPLQA